MERTLAWLGRFRRLAVRFERDATVYQGLVYLAAALACLRRLVLVDFARLTGPCA